MLLGIGITRPTIRGGSWAVTPLEFSKTCLVVRHNKQLQLFFPPEISIGQLVAALDLTVSIIIMSEEKWTGSMKVTSIS